MIRRRAAGQQSSGTSAFFASACVSTYCWLPRFRVFEHLLSTSALLVLFFAFTFTFSVPAFGGQGGEISWQARDWNGADPTAGKQEASASATDSDGNVIVTGYNSASGSDDFYTVKFSAAGAVLWRAAYNDPNNGSDRASAVAVDSNGDVIVTGYAWNGTNYDIYTIKYTSAGDGGNGVVAAGWPKTYNGSANGNDYPTAIAVVGGNVYVAGYTQNTNGKDDYVVLKYLSNGTLDTGFSSDGIEIYNSTADKNDRITSLAVNDTGVAVTGYSENSSGNFDCLTIKYSAAGAKLWELRHDGSGRDDRGMVARMDAAGDVYMTGYTSNASDKDIHVVKINGATGAKIWEQMYDGGYDDEPRDMLVDSDNSLVYLTGYTLTLEGANDFYIAKFNSATGGLLWNAIFNSANGNMDSPVGIVVNGSGEVFVTGYTYDAAAGNYDYQTVKYSGSGHLLWNKSFNGTSNKNERTVGIGYRSSTGDIYVAGWSDMWTSGASDYDYYAIKYDPGTLNRPTGLTAATVTTSQIDLAWEDNSSNEGGFKIERCAGSGCSDFAEIGTVAAGVTVYSSGGLTSDTLYKYRVRAYLGADNSYYSSEASATTTVLNPVQPTSWVYVYDGAGPDEAASITTGPDGNPVVTGYSRDNLVSLSFDYYTIKLNRTDKSVIWKGGYDNGSSGSDMAISVAVDGNNDVIVTGYSPVANNDIATLKYLDEGNLGSAVELWEGASSYAGPAGDDYAVATMVDGSNNVIVVGYGMNASGNNDIYVIRYPSACAECPPAATWSKVYSGGGEERPAAAVLDSSGNVLVAGYKHNGTNYDYLTAKFNGANGDLLWSKTYNGGGNGNDYAKSIDVDSSGYVYVTGLATNASGKTDFYTIKYNGSNGDVVWEHSYGGSAVNNYEAVSVKVDPIADDGDAGVVVAGTVETGANNHDFHIMKYNPGGAELWHKTIQRPTTEDYVVAMGMDPSGNFCVAGNTSSNGGDILAVKFKYNGDVLGANVYNGAGSSNDKAAAVTSNKLGEMFVAGSAKNATPPTGNYDYLVFKCEGSSIVVPSPFTAAVVAGNADDQRVNLSWTISMLPAGTVFNLERRNVTDGQVGWTTLLTNSSLTSYADSGLLPGKEYAYRIEADSAGTKSRKLGVYATTILNPPALTSLSVLSTTAIDIAWNNVSGNDGYKLERSPNGSSWAQIGGDLAADTDIYHDTALSVGATYYYRLSVHNISGYSLVGGTLSAVTKPAQPTMNQPTIASPVQVNLTWGDVTGETAYRLYRKEGAGGVYAQIGGDLAAGTTSYNDAGLTTWTTYYYKVRAVNASGESADSSEWSATPVLNTPALSAPTIVSATQLNLAWTDVTGESGYRLYRKEGAGVYEQIGGDLAAGTTSYNDNNGGPGLSAGTTYYYKLKAFIAAPASESPDSSEQSATTKLNAPVLSPLTPLSSSQIQADWNDPNGNEGGYKVEYVACTNTDPAACSDVGGAYWGAAWTSVTLGAGVVTTTVDSLESGRTYKFKVTATGTVNSDASTVLAASARLAGPTNLAATAISNTVIDLTWSDVVGEANYDVEKDAVDMVLALPKDTTYKQLTGLSAGTNYCFRVKPYNAIPDSAYSNQACAETPADPPVLNSVTAVSSTQIDLAWTDVASDAGYEVWRSGYVDQGNPASGWTAYAKLVPPDLLVMDTISYANTGLSAGNTFKYKIRYKLASGSFSAYSGELQATTFPAVPSISSAVAASTSQIDVSWNNVAGETGYYVQKKQRSGGDCTAGAWEAEVNKATDTITHSYTVLTTGTVYCFQVRAANAAGTSDFSAAVSQTTLLDPPTLNDPTGVTAAKIDLSWTNVAGNTGYRIERSTDGSTYGQVGSDLAADTTTLSNSGLTAGTLYYYRVRALNAGGQSVPSNVKSATTIPPTPSMSTPSASSTTQIDAAWDNVSGETGYKLQYKQLDAADCTTEVGSWTDASPAPVTKGADVTTHAATGLTEALRYCFRINAYNAAGSSAWSSSVNRVTLLSAPPLTPTIVSTSQVDLAWNSITGNTGYKIERSADNTNWTIITSPAQGATAYSDTGRSAGTLYYYRISTRNGDNVYGPLSAVQSTTTKPAAPPTLTVNLISEARADLSWQVVWGATNYKIERRVGTNGSWGEIANLAVAYGELYCGYYSTATVNCPTLMPKYTFYQNTGLTEDVEYCYQVKAWNNTGGDSAASAVQCVKTPAVGAPNLTAVTALSSRKIKLDWTYDPAVCVPNPCESPDGFEIEARTSGSKWTNVAVVANPLATTYTDTAGIQPNTPYEYRVRAYKVDDTANFNSGIDTSVWSQLGVLQGATDTTDSVLPIDVSNTTGSSMIAETGGIVRLTNTSLGTGAGGKYNYSYPYLVTPMLNGDFELQVDYTLPNGQVTPAPTQYHVYARLRVQLPNSSGGANFAYVERMVTGGKNYYRGAVRVDGAASNFSFDYELAGVENSGKLKITRNGSTMSAYVWINGSWMHLFSRAGSALTQAASSVYFIQYAQQNEAVDLVADFDNFKITDKSTYSGVRSVTTPVWQSGDDTCE